MLSCLQVLPSAVVESEEPEVELPEPAAAAEVRSKPFTMTFLSPLPG